MESAKRIEDGLDDMVMAIAACPTIVNELLEHVHRVREGAAQIDEVVDGLVDEKGEDYAGSGVTPADDDIEAGVMSSKQLEYLRIKSLKKFDAVESSLYRMQTAFEEEGCEYRTYIEAREALHAERSEERSVGEEGVRTGRYGW